MVSTTRQRAYLDAGGRDGLAVGQSLSLVRQGRAVATCVIEQLSDHHARCRGQDVRVGDLFVVDRSPPPPGAPPAPSAPPPGRPSGSAATVAASPIPKVPFRGVAQAPATARPRASAGWSHTTWAASAASAPFQQERLDFGLSNLDLAGGFRLSAEANLLWWAGRPASARYRPGAPVQLFVRQLSVSSREPGKPYAIALGRLRPRSVPGIVALDGAQAGWRSEDGGAEAGAFAGALPDPVSVSPRASFLAGAYGAFERTDAKGLLPWLRVEGRFSAAGLPELGTRGEAEALVLVDLGPADSALDARARLFGGDGPALAALRFDAGARPTQRLRLGAGYRYEGERDPELQRIEPLAYEGTAHHADVSATWLATGPLTLGASAGLASDSSGRSRLFVGPELGLVGLLAGRLGVTAGYAEERGWISGRSAYLQATATPTHRWRLLGRASYFQDALADGGGPHHEAGVFGSADLALGKGIAARASMLARLGQERADTASGWPVPGSVTASAGLRGAW